MKPVYKRILLKLSGEGLLGDKPYGMSEEVINALAAQIKEIADDSFRKDMKFLFTTHPLFTEDTIEGNSDVLKDLEAKEGEFGTIYYGNLFGSREDALRKVS